MKIARIICWPRDSTLRQTMKGGFEIVPALLPELILISLTGCVLTKSIAGSHYSQQLSISSKKTNN